MKLLAREAWRKHNLVVHIEDVLALDRGLHDQVTAFCKGQGLLTPKHVAWTIFPYTGFWQKMSAAKIYQRYNRDGGFYDWTRTKPRSGWGTYFRRMTHYETPGGEIVNQLDKVIRAIRDWQRPGAAAYTIVIPRPGPDTARPRGGPCLSHIVPQVDLRNPHRVGLLCVYRNHDFLERAYGNYWGLCNLTQFIAREAQIKPGPLTCVSSHAYVDKHRGDLRAFVDSLP